MHLAISCALRLASPFPVENVVVRYSYFRDSQFSRTHILRIPIFLARSQVLEPEEPCSLYIRKASPAPRGNGVFTRPWC